MSAHTRKHPTKNTLRKALIEKISRVDKEEDLVTLNFVIDKYIRPQKSSLTPEEAFGPDWTDQNKRLGKIIQGLRFRERLTQTELAKALKGVKQTNISAWESGKEKVPAKRLEQLSKIFGTDINKLIK
ncbi:MAG: helix-turn-helix domain-containing protein [Bacteriovoracia bacterium]